MAEAVANGVAVREAPSSKVGKVILRLYNHGLRGNSKFLLPDWIDRPGTMFKAARELARADVEQVRSGVPQE
jgi:phosphoribosylpyrophosphate synthetase